MIPNIASLPSFKRQLVLEDGCLVIVIRYHWLKYNGDCLHLDRN